MIFANLASGIIQYHCYCMVLANQEAPQPAQFKESSLLIEGVSQTSLLIEGVSKNLPTCLKITTSGSSITKGLFHLLPIGMQIGTVTVESSMELLQTINYGTILSPSNSTSGNIPKKPETLVRKNICTPMFTAELFTITRIWKQPKYPSVDEWIKKDVVYLHNEILLNDKK